MALSLSSIFTIATGVAIGGVPLVVFQRVFNEIGQVAGPSFFSFAAFSESRRHMESARN